MKVRLLVMLAILFCSGVLLLAPGVTHSGAWRFDGMTNAIGSTLKNAGVLAFGLLVGTLLTCFFDPAAKEQISRGMKSAWKRPSRP